MMICGKRCLLDANMVKTKQALGAVIALLVEQVTYMLKAITGVEFEPTPDHSLCQSLIFSPCLHVIILSNKG